MKIIALIYGIFALLFLSGTASVACALIDTVSVQDSETWFNEGNALSNLGRYEEAIVAYDKALEINPQYSDAWNNKGIALSYLNRYEEASEACNKAIEIDPQNSNAWNNKGNILKILGRYGEAIEAFDKALVSSQTYNVSKYAINTPYNRTL